MDAGIADTINRHAVQLMAMHLDRIDSLTKARRPWQEGSMAADLMGEEATATDAGRAWLVGFLAARTPDLDFDFPADCDWENLFSHFRAEILARRDPKTPPVHAAQTPVRDGVGSR
jgi:hypothetical protein